MIEINLIPTVKKELIRTRTIRNRVISISFLVGGASVALVVVLGVIFGGQLAAEALQNNGIKDKSDKLSSITDLDKVVTLQNQLSKITSQHNSKRVNSRIFDMVGAINPASPNDASFSSVKVNPESKTVTLEGSVASGYSALETLKKTILNTKVKTVDPKDDNASSEVALTSEIKDGNTSYGDGQDGKKVLQFSFSFEYPEDLLAVSYGKKVSIITPTARHDVTDSRQSIPDSLFKDEVKKSADQEGR